MVRGPAALLGAAALGLAYFLCAGALPDLGDGDAALVVAGAAGMLAIAAIALSLVWAAGDALAPVGLVLLGAGLVLGAMDAAGLGVEAVVPEALVAGAFGILMGRVLAHYAGPAVGLAIPLFVALVDAWSVASGPSSSLAQGDTRGAAELTFDLPALGGGGDAIARLGLPDAIFIACFATWAHRLGLRPRATAAGMVCGLLATIVLSVVTDRAIPALPLVAVGYWLPNLDRLAGLMKAPE